MAAEPPSVLSPENNSSTPSTATTAATTANNTSNEYKLVVVGEGVVGKSALTIQFIQGRFEAECDPTIEDSYRKQCVIDDKVAILDILDTAPHSEFSAMREQYMEKGEGFLLVYSVTDRTSFNEIQRYHKQILKVKDSENFPMVLVANKTDLANERVISPEDGQELGQILKIGYIEASAKRGLNIDKPFFDLVRAIRRHRCPELEESPNSVKKRRKSSKKKRTKSTSNNGGRCTLL